MLYQVATAALWSPAISPRRSARFSGASANTEVLLAEVTTRPSRGAPASRSPTAARARLRLPRCSRPGSGTPISAHPSGRRSRPRPQERSTTPRRSAGGCCSPSRRRSGRPTRREAPARTSPSWWSAAARPGSRWPAPGRDPAVRPPARLPADRPARRAPSCCWRVGARILPSYPATLWPTAPRSRSPARRGRPDRDPGDRRRAGFGARRPAGGFRPTPWSGRQATAPARSSPRSVRRSTAGRALVEPDCSIPGHPEVFVLGDAAAFPTRRGGSLPGVCPVAIQMGKYAAGAIRADLAGKPRRRSATATRASSRSSGAGAAWPTSATPTSADSPRGCSGSSSTSSS